MSAGKQGFTRFHFIKNFLIPAAAIFVIPVVSLAFFIYAQSRYDAKLFDELVETIQRSPNFNVDEKNQLIEFHRENPFSKLMLDEELAAQANPTLRWYYLSFRWAIRIALWAILSGIVVFLACGVCVMLSRNSPFVQYVTLAISWYVLRLFAVFQAIAQGVLLTALSFWVTALLGQFYSMKLILIVGILAGAGVCIAIAAIFRRIPQKFEVEGRVLVPDDGSQIWSDLGRICEKVGTSLPDRIIAGIDDKFFVTEYPVTVGEETYRGRTLYVSLSLLKQLNAREAEAVLAHEMAHFSGNDTWYSRKVGPMMQRYDHYLYKLHEGGITKPIYYFMLCFRVMFEVSLNKLSRDREFRADRIASETTSPRDFAGGLLRYVAYTAYRRHVEQTLFQEEQAISQANVNERIETGFPEFATKFFANSNVGEMVPAHPFDSHPPLHERLAAVGIPLTDSDTADILAAPGDGGWFPLIPMAHRLEREQWDTYEHRFRTAHDQVLAYRYLPETDAERAHVVRLFPPVSYESLKGAELLMDCERLGLKEWDRLIPFSNIADLLFDDHKVLKLVCVVAEHDKTTIDLSKFPNVQEILDAVSRYLGRYRAAEEYRRTKVRTEQESQKVQWSE
jgi:hypothetical protein